MTAPPSTPTAVKVNLERIADPANKLKRQSLLAMIDHVEVGRSAHREGRAEDAVRRLHEHDRASRAARLNSPAAIQKYGKDLGRNPVGTGPFKFVSWSARHAEGEAQSELLAPGLAASVNSVTVRSVPENGARIAMLQAGEAQYISVLPPEMVKVVQANPKLDLINTPSIITRYVALNTMKKPFDDLRVRQALNYAVDKDAFIKVVWSGFADPMDSPEPPQLTFYQKQSRRALAARSGEGEAAAGRGGLSERVRDRDLGRQQHRRDARHAVHPAAIRAGRREAHGDADGSGRVELESVLRAEAGGRDGADLLYRLVGLDRRCGLGVPPALLEHGLPAGAVQRLLLQERPDVDKDVQDALLTADPAVRGKAYADAQKRVWEDAPVVWLSIDRILDAQREEPEGRVPHPGWRLPAGATAEFV